MTETDSVPTVGAETKEQWDEKPRFHTHYITGLYYKGKIVRIEEENKGFSKRIAGIDHVEINGVVRVTYRDGLLSARGGLKAHAHDNLLLVYSHD